MNLVALAKQSWCLLCDSYAKWSLILKGLYFSKGLFWEDRGFGGAYCLADIF